MFGKKSYRNANVSEALADFFGTIYSLKRATDRFVVTAKDRIAVAENKYNSWVKWDGSGWPYAYALYFMKNKLRCFSPAFADYKDKGCIIKLIASVQSGLTKVKSTPIRFMVTLNRLKLPP